MSEGVSEEFREKVRTLLKLDDDIATAQEMLKELRSRKGGLQSDVTKYMKENNIRTCNTPGGKLMLSTTRRGVAPKKEEVARSVAERLGVDLEKMEQAFEEAKKTKRYVEGVSLRRVRQRVDDEAREDEEEASGP